MLGAKAIPNPIQGKVIYAEYGRIKDLAHLNVKGAILLEQRGSDIKGEKVFFSIKEKNAADAGAIGLIVFNNQEGIFFGDLMGPNSTKEYHPRIPTISMSQQDGLKLKSKNNTIGNLNIFYHPDFVAPFSSRGPVSPFYVKPDLVAPGVFVNTTTMDGRYNITSGTSIATPHVTGAVALLLQKHPNLNPTSIASLISTTTDPVTDPYNKILPIEVAGSGRLNITRAESANLIIIPHSLVFHLSYDTPTQTQVLNLDWINNSTSKLQIHFSSTNPTLVFNYHLTNSTLEAQISDHSKNAGVYQGFIIIDDSKTLYRIPVSIYLTKGTLDVTSSNGEINFSLIYPNQWSYAKISIMESNTHEVKITSITPKNNQTISVHQPGLYWIEADIKTGNQTDHAYQTLIVNHTSQNISFEDITHIPLKQTIIIFLIVAFATILVLISRR